MARLTITFALPTGNPLSITDAFCIEAVGVDSSYEGEMKEVIEATIAELDFWRHRYAETVIDFGCPYPPIDYTKHPRGRLVDAESYYDAYIYILPLDTIERYFSVSEIGFASNVIRKSPRVHLTAEEMTCAGDSCAQVSYGLYLTPEDVPDRNLYLDELCWAIGAGMPEYTDWPPNPCNNYRASPTSAP